QRPRRHPTGSRRYPFHRHIATCPLDPSALGVASLLPLCRARGARFLMGSRERHATGPSAPGAQ
ncbi:MAG: hypothetical protein ACPIOQ_81740, partial [Promethearchaeia archaeon]